MTLYVSGSIIIKGEEYFCGEIAQAAKNLYMWKQFKYPVTRHQLSTQPAPPIVAKGRCKNLSQAEHKLETASQEIVAQLKRLQKVILEETEESNPIQLEESERA